MGEGGEERRVVTPTEDLVNVLGYGEGKVSYTTHFVKKIVLVKWRKANINNKCFFLTYQSISYFLFAIPTEVSQKLETI